MKMIDIIKCIDKSNNKLLNYFIINNIDTVNTDEILELLHKYMLDQKLPHLLLSQILS